MLWVNKWWVVGRGLMRTLTWLERRKAACTARRDLVESEPLTTAEMIRSEEPCEMASTFTPALPSALKNLPAVVGVSGYIVVYMWIYVQRTHEGAHARTGGALGVAHAVAHRGDYGAGLDDVHLVHEVGAELPEELVRHRLKDEECGGMWVNKNKNTS